MISCGRSGWLAQNFAMLLGIPAHRRSHFERGLAVCSILCLPFRLSSRCFVMRCRTELPWIAWTGPPTASPKCYAKDQARDTLRIGRDWPVKPVIREHSTAMPQSRAEDPCNTGRPGDRCDAECSGVSLDCFCHGYTIGRP